MSDELLHPAALLIAVLADAALGEPFWLYRRMAHPIVLIGAVIAWVDRRFNRESDGEARRKQRGIAVTAVLVLAALGLGWAIQAALLALPLGLLWLGLAMSTLIAQQSLYVHVADVAKAMELSGLEGGRIAVARIVGRDPEALDSGGVSRAAIESLAENFSDGIVASIFWGLVLPGMLAYKVINTMDSMIGHKTPRHQAFGWAAARLDDVVNLPASRLSAVLLVLAAVVLRCASPRAAIRAVRRDAARHKSPNSGWPEAAMAAALGLRFGGPRSYNGEMVDLPYMGDGRDSITRDDIQRGLRVLSRAMWLMYFGLLLVAFLVAAVEINP